MLPSKNNPRCNFQFEFDKGDAVFDVNDTVSGTLVVTANQDTVCNKIVIQHRWQTHGRGNRTSGDWQKESFQVSHNKLTANESQRIPFSFDLPAGPVTYRGDYLNVDWYIKGIVDARGPFDPSHEEELIVLPKALDTAYISNYVPGNTPQAKPITINSSQKNLIIAFAMLSGAIMTILIPLIMGLSKIIMLFGLVSLAIAGAFFYKGIRNSIATQKLGPIKMQLSQNELLPDETFNCQLSFNPLKDVNVQAITFRIKADEKVISGSGSNSKTHTNCLYDSEYSQLENKSILASEEVKLEQTITLPSNAAYSFSATDNKLEWYCEVSIDIEGWPNWQEKLPIQVVPWHAPTAKNHRAASDAWSDYENEQLA